MDYLSQHIEALIFSAPKTIKFDEIKDALQTAFDTKIKKADLQKSLDELVEKYKDEQYAFEIINIAEGYQFLTKSLYFNSIAEFIKLEAKRKLSKAALETLAIIAYKEPIPKSEAEKIRGVSCDYTVQKLLEKELIEIKGRSDGPGRPLLYGTSKKFLDYFGISGKNDLPQLKDFATPDSEIGEPKGIEENNPESSSAGEESPELEIADTEAESVSPETELTELDIIDTEAEVVAIDPDSVSLEAEAPDDTELAEIDVTEGEAEVTVSDAERVSEDISEKPTPSE